MVRSWPDAIAARTVDEWHLFLNSVVVGGGKCALPDGLPADLELVDDVASSAALSTSTTAQPSDPAHTRTDSRVAGEGAGDTDSYMRQADAA